MSEKILEIKNVCKSFYSVKAVNDVTFSINKGEIHAICGENGAGKSTLMNLIAGIYKYDSGEMFLDGKKYSPKDPSEARRAGVSIVFQELSMFPLQNTVSNIFAGKELVKGISLDKDEMKLRTQKILDEMELDIDLNVPVEQLTIGQRQWIEIARAISDEAEILILDEPNSALNIYETMVLFKIIRKLASKGMTIIYISHRMDEVFDISDRISVMRDGKYIKTLNTKETNIEEIISLMLGRDNVKCLYTREINEKGAVVLDVRNLSAGKKINNISFSVHEGEVIGLSGLAGSGYETLINAIFGLEKIDQGEVFMENEKVSINSPSDAMKKEISMVPSDRRDTGLMTSWSIMNNISQSILRLDSKNGLLDHKKNREISEEYVKKLNVVCNSIESEVIELSGGNQQKVLLAKWLATQPKLLIMDDPTRGIDIGAKQEIYQLIDRITKQGFAVILTSSEIDEVTALSDKILLFRDGKLVKTVLHGTPKGEILNIIAGRSSEKPNTAHQEPSGVESKSDTKESSMGKVLTKVKKSLSFKESGVLIALIVVFLGFSIFVKSFASGANIAVILKQMSILGILTFGMTYVFCANEVDLSIGYILNSTMACMALLMTKTSLNPWICVLLGLVFATLLGTINGFLAIGFNLPTIVVTLGTVSIYKGLALILNNGKTISGLPAGSFLNMARFKVCGMSMLSIVAIVVFIILTWVFHRTTFARHLLLTGDNSATALRRGIDTKKLRVEVMALSGFLCGIGAMLALSNLTSADTQTGSDYAMSAIGAVVIGGTKMGGGSGSMVGSLIGIALVTIIQSGLAFLGLQSGWRSLFIGLMMIVAIFIDTFVEGKAKKSSSK